MMNGWTALQESSRGSIKVVVVVVVVILVVIVSVAVRASGFSSTNKFIF